ncbi:MAG: hypothetical protein ACRDN0_40780 [Trebonia sp.]
MRPDSTSPGADDALARPGCCTELSECRHRDGGERAMSDLIAIGYPGEATAAEAA